MRPAWQGALVWLARIVMAGIFLSFAWDKLLDPAEFAESIYNYRMLPDGSVNLLALFLPWLEWWSAIALLAVAPFRRAAWWWFTLMLLVFTYAKVSALQRGLDIGCGCSAGPESTDPMTWKDVAFNVWLLAVCGLGLVLDHRGRTRTPGL